MRFRLVKVAGDQHSRFNLIVAAGGLALAVAAGCGGTNSGGSTDFTGTSGATSGGSTTTTTTGGSSTTSGTTGGSSAIPAHYTFTDLSKYTNPHTNTQAVSINNHGSVLVTVPIFGSHVYVAANGAGVDYGVGRGLSISDSGVVYGDAIANLAYYGAVLSLSGNIALPVGSYSRVDPAGSDSSGDTFGTGIDVGQNSYAIVIKGGTLSTIGPQNSSIFAANAAGTAVGVADNLPEEFNTSGSTMQLNLPSGFANSGDAFGINSSGTAVGAALGSGPVTEEAEEWSESGSVTELTPSVSGSRCEARAINSSGIVVGWTGVYPHACIFVVGKSAIDLNTSGYVTNLPSRVVLAKALAINSSGDIVGYAQVGASQHAFILIPSSS